MFDLLLEMWSYPFMVRAMLVGTIVALCSSLLGVSLVLKRYSMIGDGLSHVGFGALALATAFNMAPLTVAIPVVVLAAFLLLRISESGKMKDRMERATLESELHNLRNFVDRIPPEVLAQVKRQQRHTVKER